MSPELLGPGVLVEQEIFGQMEQIWTLYLRLLGEVASLRVGRGVDMERAIETQASRASEINGLRKELEESNRKARRLDEDLRERDYAMA
ncbi:uncharacterized protein A4U43_C07F28430 [Asparagus officinalis]|uniref:Uncharacterized protein n=1 Tax=Asparagus officinalis TaxID=4686 RepID=A0A5P1EFW7_ASPOF|nr:uncharacterized protein A4U43_C07F28430 [Asparagus officinalis]